MNTFWSAVANIGGIRPLVDSTTVFSVVTLIVLFFGLAIEVANFGGAKL